MGLVLVAVVSLTLGQMEDESFTIVGNTLVRYFESNKTYVEARRQCLSLGSQLLEIWNEDEWNEVKGPESVTLIGLTDLDFEGEFVWGSGRPLSRDVAAFWKEGQPNNHYGLEHCTCIVKGVMMDRICEDPSPKDPEPHGFVCQTRGR